MRILSIFLFLLTLFPSKAIATAQDFFPIVQKIYIAYYQRPADPEGLIYWSQKLAEANGDLREIIDAFANSPEAQELYGNKSVSEVLTEIYQAAFNRNPDPEGLEFYTEKIESGEYSLTDVMLRVLDGARGDDALILEKKIQAAQMFTESIDLDLDGRNFTVTYAGSRDAQVAREWLKSIVPSPDAELPPFEEIRSQVIKILSDFPERCPVIEPVTFSLSQISKQQVEKFFIKFNGRKVYSWDGNWENCDLTFDPSSNSFKLVNCSNPENESSGFIYENNGQTYLHFDKWDVKAKVISATENNICLIDFSEDGSIFCLSGKPEGYSATSLEGHYWIVYDWNPNSFSWEVVKDNDGNVECWGFNEGKIYYGNTGVIGTYQLNSDKIVHLPSENGNFSLEYYINLQDINLERKIIGMKFPEDNSIKVFVKVY